MAAPSAPKTLMFAVIAVGAGLVAAVLSGLYLSARERQIAESMKRPDEQLVLAVTAKQSLPKGLRIKADMFNVESLPARYVHANAIAPKDFGAYEGHFLIETLPAGRPLLTNFLDRTFPVDFSDLVKQGRRGMTITVDEVNSIGGHIRAGNIVDLYVNIAAAAVGLQAEAQAQPTMATDGSPVPGDLQPTGASGPTDFILPVLQGVRVLATGEATYDETLDELMRPQRNPGRRFTNLTLDVSPQEGALLAAALDKGDPIALLRNRQDKGFAEFSTVTTFDLIQNAVTMQQQAAMREAAAKAGATVDANGNWVMADGTVIKKEDVVVGADGTVMTRGGKVLAAAGLKLNEKGEYVDASGRVIAAGDVVVNPDGTVTTKQELMAKAGYTVNENGDYVDASGRVIPKDDVVVNADGTVTTKQALMAQAGYTVNANGDYVDANGNVIPKDSIKVLANGSVVAADGTVLAGPKVTTTKDGFLVAADGTVMTADGKVVAGARVNEKGEVVTADGTVLSDPNLQIAADGTVRDSSGRVVDGVTLGGGAATLVAASGAAPAAGAPATGGAATQFDRMAETFLETEGGPAAAAGRRGIDLIVGGKGKDGVAPVSELPVLQ